MSDRSPSSQDSRSLLVAQSILNGFNKHYFLFSQANAQAKGLFEAAHWHGIQELVANRIQMYDDRVKEAVTFLRETCDAAHFSDAVWQQAKTLYIALLVNHKQPELAETFFNSVCCKILDRAYFNNDFIFFKPATSTEYIESDPPTFKSFYPNKEGLRGCLQHIIGHFNWQRPFAHLNHDLSWVLRAAKAHFKEEWPPSELNLHLQVLHAPFYRNKGAYIFGQIVNGSRRHPFALAILHDEQGQLVIDTALFHPEQIAVLFSFARAYFLVDMDVPSAYVNFLHRLLPMRHPHELYTMLGLQKQGKNIFYREFIQHLNHSNDQFTLAPGVKGLVMLVFTLPTFPYVFKLIKDVFGPNKDFGRKEVKEKYLLVKRHDRVGRMADTLEFSNVAFPLERCDPLLLAELRALAPSQIEESDGLLVVKHLYIERRLKPLNLFMQSAQQADKDNAIIEYGNALKELASANIFPGDMLYKNFGMTRYGRVIFYDYDEIEYMTDCQFRAIPAAPNPEYELSSEVWYPVNKGDVFPEEFGPFLLGEPDVRQVFLKHHRDLLTPQFWQGKKDRILAGLIEDFYPYPETGRFPRLPPTQR